LPKKTPARHDLDLDELITRIQRVNPTGRGLRRSDERARYAEKARLQSLLIEYHSHDVRVRLHHDMPGVVSLSVPRLQASAGHALVDALSARARHWIDLQLQLLDPVDPPSRNINRPAKPTSSLSFVDRAEKFLAEYDFDCAIQQLTDGAQDSRIDKEERIRALLLLLEIHVDHLANDVAALEIESALQALGGISERAHELLGTAATRAGDVARALHHLGKCRGERVGAELATIARKSMASASWADAFEAWTHLNGLAASTSPPLATSLAMYRDDFRQMFVQEAMGKLGTDIEADPHLERFVRAFAPRHPWLYARREHEEKARLEASVRNALQKARSAMASGDVEGISFALETIPDGGLVSDVEAAEVVSLKSWVEERRAAMHAARAISLAYSDDLEAACRAYLALSVRAREHLRDQGSAPLFEAVNQLNAVFPERTNARPLLRAAIALTQAFRSAHPQSIDLAPHATWLEAVPAFASYIHCLDEQRESPGAFVVSSAEEVVPVVRAVSIDGVRFSELNDTREHLDRIEYIARRTIRLGTESFVVTIGSAVEPGAWILSFWSCRTGIAPRHVHMQATSPWRPRRVSITKHGALLLDDQGALWVVTLSSGISVRRILPPVDGPHVTPDIIAMDDDHCAIRAGDESKTPETWYVVHLPSGAVRATLHGPRSYWGFSGRGASFYRVSGLCVERFDSFGRVVDHFELPRNVNPVAIVESVVDARPIVLASSFVRSCIMAWWQPQPRFFRTIELFDEAEYGEYWETIVVPERGIIVATLRRDGALFFHECVVEKGILRLTRHVRSTIVHPVFVHDIAGRRVWLVRCSLQRFVDICELTIPIVSA
jgi:hypothetical protein